MCVSGHGLGHGFPVIAHLCGQDAPVSIGLNRRRRRLEFVTFLAFPNIGRHELALHRLD